MSERNSPNKVGTKAKFSKNCWTCNEDSTCKISGDKSVKKAKKLATTIDEVHRLPLREQKTAKKTEKNFRLKTVQVLAQTCNAEWQKFTLHWLGRNDKQRKEGFIYARFGSKVRGSDYNRSAIFFSQLCFFSVRKQSWIPTDLF